MVTRGQRWRIEGEDHHGRYSRSTKGRKGAGDIGHWTTAQQRSFDHDHQFMQLKSSSAIFTGRVVDSEIYGTVVL